MGSNFHYDIVQSCVECHGCFSCDSLLFTYLITGKSSVLYAQQLEIKFRRRSFAFQGDRCCVLPIYNTKKSLTLELKLTLVGEYVS